MIKFIIINLLILSSFNTYAQVTLSECEQAAINYSSKIAPATTISSDCYTLIEAQRNYINNDFSIDNYIEMTAYKNILFTKVYTLDINNNTVLDANRITAGHETKLTDIQAIDFNENDATIYVLNKNGTDYSILSFYYNISGNISPLRELHSTELNFASNLKVDDVNKKIIAVSSSANWIKVFQLKADPNGKKSENSTQLVRSLHGAATTLIAPIDIATSTNEYFVLDSDRIVVFNRTDDGAIAPKRVISGSNTTLSGAKKIEINSNNEIEITNGNNSIVKFSLTGNGNISPL